MAHVCPPRAHGITEAERSCVGGDIGLHTSPALWGLRWALGALRSNRDEALPCCRVFGPLSSRERGMSEVWGWGGVLTSQGLPGSPG